MWYPDHRDGIRSQRSCRSPTRADSLDEVVRDHILHVLALCGNHKTRAPRSCSASIARRCGRSSASTASTYASCRSACASSSGAASSAPMLSRTACLSSSSSRRIAATSSLAAPAARRAPRVASVLVRRRRRRYGERRRRRVATAVLRLIRRAERRAHPHPRERIGRGHRNLRERVVRRDRLHAALGLEVHVERAGHVAAEELGERVVARAGSSASAAAPAGTSPRCRSRARSASSVAWVRSSPVCASTMRTSAPAADLRGELVERDVPAIAGVVEPAVAVLLDQDRRHGPHLTGTVAALQAGFLLHRKRPLDRSLATVVACPPCRPGSPGFALQCSIAALIGVRRRQRRRPARTDDQCASHFCRPTARAARPTIDAGIGQRQRGSGDGDDRAVHAEPRRHDHARPRSRSPPARRRTSGSRRARRGTPPARASPDGSRTWDLSGALANDADTHGRARGAGRRVVGARDFSDRDVRDAAVAELGSARRVPRRRRPA